MKLINIDDVSKSKKKLTVQIEPTDLTVEKEEAYEELGKEAVIPGFRKGKVPRKFLELRFDKAVRKEAFGDAVFKALDDISKDRDLRIIGKPVFDPPEFDDLADKVCEEPVEMGVTIEVIPPFELPQYSQLKLPIELETNVEQMVDSLLEVTRQRSAIFTTVDDRPTCEGDHVVIQCTTTRGGEDFPAITAPRLMVNDLGDSGFPAAFEKGLVNLEKGANFDFDFSIESDHPLFLADGENSCHTRGKILSISEKDIPALDDDFAKDHNFESLAAFRKRLTEDVQHNEDRHLATKKRDTIQNYLLDNTDVVVPSSLIQNDYLLIRYRKLMDAQQHGDTGSMIPSDEEEVETMFQAEQESKRRLILQKIAEKEAITVSDDEYIESMIALARSRKEKNLDRFLAQVEKDGLEHFYKEQILFGKVGKWLVDHNEFEVNGSSAGETGSGPSA
ncbi:trigger factor [bacterium]|nr:MAG: Trigger factor [Candidatus Hinthialibacteria bacterium OLB16]MCK6496420.1 trigger factor [bacterium]NUP91871.1 trigger factor [Candidatus Omnitrophota bacterium]